MVPRERIFRIAVLVSALLPAGCNSDGKVDVVDPFMKTRVPPPARVGMIMSLTPPDAAYAGTAATASGEGGSGASTSLAASPSDAAAAAAAPEAGGAESLQWSAAPDTRVAAAEPHSAATAASDGVERMAAVPSDGATAGAASGVTVQTQTIGPSPRSMTTFRR